MDGRKKRTTKTNGENKKTTYRQSRNVDTGEVFDSVKKAAEKYGLKDTHISRVCKGKRKTTGGFKWEYV